MGLIVKKHREAIVGRDVKFLSFVNFLFALALASVTTIWALYMKSFLGTDYRVGMVSSILSAVSLISYFFLVPLTEKYDKKKLFVFSTFFIFVFYILFSYVNSLGFFLLCSLLITIVYALRAMSFGIIIKSKSKKESVSKNEGLIFTFLNLGWILGPLIGGFLMSRFGFNMVFFVSSFIVLFTLILFYLSNTKVRNFNNQEKDNIFVNVLEFFRDKERRKIYFLTSGVSNWWIFIYLFIPLYIVDRGLDVRWVGYFLLAVAVPLIILEYWFSEITSKYGFKKIFALGFLFVSIISFLGFFINSIFLLMGILVLASVGMAMVEPTTESYFLKIENKKQMNRFYGPFSTSRDGGQFIGKVISSLILAFLSFKFLFIFYGLVMLLMFFVSLKIRNR